MARWKLTEAHYINATPPDLEKVEWEYKEGDRITGRERRHRYVVPMYCEAEVIVARQDSARDGDYIYNGPPTPAMTPLDDEAKAISAEFESTWIHPVESLPGQGFNDSILQSLEKQLAIIASNQQAQPVPLGTVSREEFDTLKSQLEALLARNAQLENEAAKTETRRRA